MNADYITHWGTDLSAVNAARVSMNKESWWEVYDEEGRLIEFPQDWEIDNYKDKRLSAKDEKLIYYLAKNKHTSCFEHQGVTLRLKVPLFVRSQIHRHRTFSYNEISRRYVKDDLEFYWPEKWRKAAENVKQGSSDEEVQWNSIWQFEDGASDVHEHINDSVLLFNHMVNSGVCAEQARMILPQNLYTQFYMTGNLRNWAHFLKLRLDSHAQREVQEVAKMCETIIAPFFPVSYKALMENE